MKYLYLILFSVASCFVYGQGFLTVDGKEIVNEQGQPYLLKGMGLGGWMLQEGYMLQTAGFANAQHQIRERMEQLMGAERTQEFYDAWLQNHVTSADIDSLHSWGFNSVRLPMHYDLFTLPIEDEPIPGEQTWLDLGFELTDSLISWCAAHDMYVILDLHAAPGGQGQDEGISDYDVDKPSLWESDLNLQKTVALWRRIADRYKEEPLVAGYDLINETNWPLENNQKLKDLYLDITAAIREVDTQHIIFIEGNWFANDFTNLTPPWDDLIVYSPHKYWSINDQESIQWVLDIREQFDVPLYLGETGENSNPWFSDAINLFAEHNIGWAWWPMKKIESISGPLSVIKTPEYDELLDFWNNGGPRPSADFAYATLMETAELLKIENCVYQKDVIDAMFRQIESPSALAFRDLTVPGSINPIDYDMGGQGVGYSDVEIANFHVSTGNFTSWNNGWAYRNDGVDIEKTEDPQNGSGFNIGWIDSDEWLKYTVDIEEDGLYDVTMRIASNQDGGQLHFLADGTDITTPVSIPSTGGWQEWTSQTIQDMPLFASYSDLSIYFDNEGFNLGPMTFVKTGEIDGIDTEYISGSTDNGTDIFLSINKPLDSGIQFSASDFDLFVDGMAQPIASVTISDPSNLLHMVSGTDINGQANIRVSYSGRSLQSIDEVALSPFNNQIVRNNQSAIHFLPARIQAENFSNHNGIQLESTTDAGGGQNIGFLDVGDYADYQISVPEAGRYSVSYRTAAESESGGLRLSLVNEDDSTELLEEIRFPSTGGWQNWQTTDSEVRLPAGRHTLRVEITHPLFNINWLQFSIASSSDDLDQTDDIVIYPSPAQESLQIVSMDPTRKLERVLIYATNGALVLRSEQVETIDISSLTDGMYIVTIIDNSGKIAVQQIEKIN